MYGYFLGAPQGTKLGPLLRLFYIINNLQVDNYCAVKYADDTSFYKCVCYPGSASVAPAIQATLEWSNKNFMSLNFGSFWESILTIIFLLVIMLITLFLSVVQEHIF